MKFFNFNKEKKEETKTTSHSVPKIKLSDVDTFLPYIKDKAQQEWVNYGIDNLYPEFLTNLYLTSPTHGAICKTKSLITNSKFTWNEQNFNDTEYIIVKTLITKLKKELSNITLDLQIYGGTYLEIIRSIDKKNIVRINRISPEKIRSGKLVDGKVNEYYFCNDWSNFRREGIVTIPVFDIQKDNSREILFISQSMISNDYYPDLNYSGGLNWISLESETGVFYRSLIQNGFNPGLIFKFPNLAVSEEEEDEIVDGLSKQYAGSKNTGKPIVIFANGEENMVQIDTIQPGQTDKQFTVIAEQIVTKILTSHGVVTPELFGIAESGRLGNSDYVSKLKTFIKFQINPVQELLEDHINELFMSFGKDINFKFDEIKAEELFEDIKNNLEDGKDLG